MVLQTSDLTVRRSGARELVFENFELARGQNLLLLGPSGAGKTTLLSMIAGFLPPSSGTVTVDNTDLYKMSAAQRDALRGKKLGFVFQTLHLLPTLTILDNILLASKMAGLDADGKRASHLLDAMGLSHKKNCKPAMLSQGEQQRAAIARALMNKPEILIADEPTSALDDRNAEKIMDILEEQVRATGAALIVATHDSRIAGRFDSTLILQNLPGDAP